LSVPGPGQVWSRAKKGGDLKPTKDLEWGVVLPLWMGEGGGGDREKVKKNGGGKCWRGGYGGKSQGTEL